MPQLPHTRNINRRLSEIHTVSFSAALPATDNVSPYASKYLRYYWRFGNMQVAFWNK
jgi:hypothetical protein